MIMFNRSHALEVSIGCLLPILVGWAIVHGPYMNSSTLFVPWTHDDFAALSSLPRFLPWYARPVTQNLVNYLAPLGAGTFYVTLLTTWLIGFALTYALVIRLFQVSIGPAVRGLIAFIGAITLFSLPASAHTVQYLGMTTSAVAYLFAMVASHAILSTADEKPHTAHYAAVALFSFLSAFSKEDMAAFLIAICCYSSLLAAWRGAAIEQAIRQCVVLVAIVGACYILSIAHSLAVGSPIVSKSGAYDFSNALLNIAKNAIFYLRLSRGAVIILVTFTLMTITATLLSLRNARLRPAAASAAFMLVGAVALIFPYLILPRAFDYYAMNFAPLIVLSLGPMIIAIAAAEDLPRLIRAIASIGVTLAVALAVIWADTLPRYYNFMWLANVRELSRRQIEEVLRANDLALARCAVVKITGVDKALGPFLATSASYLNQRLGRDLRWEIATEPNSLLANFAKSITTERSWLYIDKNDINLALRKDECWLEFRPDTFRATIHRSPDVEH